MSIAILGWGSLIWDPRELGERIGPWLRPGAVLPIEFSRISSGDRLTLVIDEQHGVWVPTQYTLSTRLTLEEAILDMSAREGTTQPDAIGFVDRRDDTRRSRSDHISDIITTWLIEQSLDAAVWTDLATNFASRRRVPFSVAAAAAYVSDLEEPRRQAALEYVRNAPVEIDTPVRRLLVEQGVV